MKPRGSKKVFGETTWDALVVGLGNPKGQYAGTLHNLGFDVIEGFVERHGGTFSSTKDNADVAHIKTASRSIAVIRPTTFMNESGRAVASALKKHQLDSLRDLIICHDELDIEPGRIKLKIGGGLGGHNGLRSIRDHVGSTDFSRIRIGVGKPPGGKDGGARHVLGGIPNAIKDEIAIGVVSAIDALDDIVESGFDSAMGTHNQRTREP